MNFKIAISSLLLWIAIAAVLVLVLDASSIEIERSPPSGFGGAPGKEENDDGNGNGLVQIQRKKRYSSGYSTYGRWCRTSCRRSIDTDYYWCYTDRSDKDNWNYDWDYCSTSAYVDYKGSNCAHKCNYGGYSYQWCYLESGSWGYCSK